MANDINSIKMLFLPPDEKQQQQVPHHTSSDQHHPIPSIDSTVVIRQLPSQGIAFQLWPAASTLVNLLDDYRTNPSTNPFTPLLSKKGSNLNILELGSGTGLVGIAAAVILGANVTVTDLPIAVPNLQFNVDANASLLSLSGGTVRVAPLRWGEAGDAELLGRDFDLILASDVVYHDHLFEPLLETLRFFLTEDGEETKKITFVMSHLRRWKKDSVFFKKAKKLFQVETLHVDRPCDGARTGVVVYSFVGKPKKILTRITI